MLITADGGYRRGEVFPLKPPADEALASTPDDRARRGRAPRRQRRRRWQTGRDHWYHELMAAADPATARPSRWTAEELLFLLYTSGTTGKPKGIMHTTRRLPHPGGVHPQVRVRPPPRDRRLLVHRRRRLDHRPQLHRLRPARQRRHAGDVRGRAQLSRATTASGRSSRSTASRSSTPRPPPSARS